MWFKNSKQGINIRADNSLSKRSNLNYAYILNLKILVLLKVKNENIAI